MHTAREGRFVAHPDKGEVSSLTIQPVGATHGVVFGHGYGTDLRHRNVAAIVSALADVGIASFRYNHPYRERGGGRDSRAVTLSTIESAVAAAAAALPDLTLLAGGHSFSGRMTTHAAAEGLVPHVEGLVLVGFPLHAGAPDVKRAAHLPQVSQSMLFLTGTRDKMANKGLISQVVSDLGDRAMLHLLDTADHGLNTLKSRARSDTVYEEIATVTAAWVAMLQGATRRS